MLEIYSLLLAAATLAANVTDSVQRFIPANPLAGEPVTALLIIDCEYIDDVRFQNGALRITLAEKSICFFAGSVNTHSEYARLGRLPAGHYPVEIWRDGSRSEQTVLSVQEAPAGPSVDFDGWWSEPGTGNGVLVQFAPNGDLFGSWATYDAVTGQPMFYTLQNFKRGVDTNWALTGELYLTQANTSATATTTTRVGSAALNFSYADKHGTCRGVPNDCRLTLPPDYAIFRATLDGASPRTLYLHRLALPRD
jgi:hypothetical protein